MYEARIASIVVAAIAAKVLAVPATAMASDEPQSALAIQGGWWSVEVEAKARLVP